MKKSNVEIIRALESALGTETLVGVSRAFDGRTWRGFIVGLEEEWLLLHVVSGGVMRLNGYVVLRVSDIERVWDDESFAPAALKLRGERPRPQPDLLLLDLPGILSSAAALFPLVAIFRDRLPNGGCYIGKVTALRRKKFALKAVNRGGEWLDEFFEFRYKDVTQIDLGDGYLDALWLVARQTRKEIRG